MSRLDPDELARLLTQAVEPVRPGPEAYQRIRDGVDQRRRMRLPLYAVMGFAAAALFLLAAVALRPGPSTQLVEPSTLPAGSASSQVSPTQEYRGGSSGGRSDPWTGPRHTSGATSTPAPPVTPPTGTPTTATSPSTSSSPGGDGGSPPMPPPTTAPAKNGDIDGDGVPDEVTLVGATQLQVKLSRGSQVSLTMQDAVPLPLHHSVIDVNGDGYGELFVRSRAENGVEWFVLLRLTAPDAITAVKDDHTLLVAGIDTGHGSATGFRCASGSLISYSGTAVGAGQYAVVTQTWHLDGTNLAWASSTPPTQSTDMSMFRPDCGQFD